MADDLRVAVIGFGIGGRVFHAPLIEATPGLRVATIVTSDPDRQADARSRYPGASVVAGADAIWSAADHHDLVVITTPNVAHVPLALDALGAGLPVVLDKPMASSAADGERVVAEAAKHGLLLSVFQNRRWDGDFLTVRRLLGQRAIGPVLRFESRFDRWRPERRPGAWRELGAPGEAGGLLFDLGSHLIDQAIVLFGHPSSVYAEVDRRRPGVEVDDDTFVALSHPGGERSHLWASVTTRLLGPRFRVLGLEGAYVKHGLDPQEDALASGADPSVAGWGREAEDRWGTLADGTGERPLETEPGDYPAYYAAIATALHDGGPPPVDPRDSIDGLRVIEAAQRSAREGAVVELEW